MASVRAGNVTGGPSTAVMASIERLAAPGTTRRGCPSLHGLRQRARHLRHACLPLKRGPRPDRTGRRSGRFLNRWAGQGNAAYEDAAQHLIQEMESFGLEVNVQRYEYTDWRQPEP